MYIKNFAKDSEVSYKLQGSNRIFRNACPYKNNILPGILLPCSLQLAAFIYICSMQHVTDDLQVRWLKLRIKLKERFGIKPDMDGILFLIGIQELGTGKQDFNKEEKQDLMHIAVCSVLSLSGYYIMEGHDEDGWPHFKQLKPLPGFIMIEQENFLKDHILLYFQNQNFID